MRFRISIAVEVLGKRVVNIQYTNDRKEAVLVACHEAQDDRTVMVEVWELTTQTRILLYDFSCGT